jgi:hypothetical protein
VIFITILLCAIYFIVIRRAGQKIYVIWYKQISDGIVLYDALIFDNIAASTSLYIGSRGGDSIEPTITTKLTSVRECLSKENNQ